MMIVAGVALYTFSLFIAINPTSVKILLFADLFFVIIASIYWYLQVLPINISSIAYGENIRSDRLQNQLENINEIEQAISIYSISHSTDEDTTEEVEELVKYVSDRTEIFGYNTDFRKFNISVLKSSTKLKLFKLSLDTLKTRLLEQKSNEDESFKNKTAEESNKDKSLDRMTKLVDMATTRLKTEIAQLSKRSDIYIIFGSGITLIAGAILYFTVQDLLEAYQVKKTQNISGLTSTEIFSVFIRFSIVVFIEVFAFYYLRLYRNIMDNIKYYQNEITNIEMKILSLHAVENGSCSESLKNLTLELAKTERNFVIDKNKTTVDLERNKLETDFFKSSTDNFVKLVKSIKS